jgi:hypothetical protein
MYRKAAIDLEVGDKLHVIDLYEKVYYVVPILEKEIDGNDVIFKLDTLLIENDGEKVSFKKNEYDTDRFKSEPLPNLVCYTSKETMLMGLIMRGLLNNIENTTYFETLEEELNYFISIDAGIAYVMRRSLTLPTENDVIEMGNLLLKKQDRLLAKTFTSALYYSLAKCGPELLQIYNDLKKVAYDDSTS